MILFCLVVLYILLSVEFLKTKHITKLDVIAWKVIALQFLVIIRSY